MYHILLTEDEDKALLKAEYGLPLTEEEKKLLKRAMKKFKSEKVKNPAKSRK